MANMKLTIRVNGVTECIIKSHHWVGKDMLRAYIEKYYFGGPDGTANEYIAKNVPELVTISKAIEGSKWVGRFVAPGAFEYIWTIEKLNNEELS